MQELLWVIDEATINSDDSSKNRAYSKHVNEILLMTIYLFLKSASEI